MDFVFSCCHYHSFQRVHAMTMSKVSWIGSKTDIIDVTDSLNIREHCC